MTRTDTNRNLVAALSYFLGFITGVVILLVEKDDKYVRFHAMQSVLIFGGLFVVNLVVGIVFGSFSVLGVAVQTVNTLISIVGIIAWVVSMVKAFKGEVFKWPVVGDIAEKKVGKAA